MPLALIGLILLAATGAWVAVQQSGPALATGVSTPTVDATAQRWVQYRNAVNVYAEQHRGQNPAPAICFSPSSMNLPPAVVVPSSWGCLVQVSGQSETVYVYGPLSASVGAKAAALLDNPVNVGKNVQGALVPPDTTPAGITVPTAVPGGDFVSVISLG